MMILLGDVVTASRDIGGDVAIVSGRISGLVQKDNGDLKYFFIKGIENAFWLSEGWVFDDLDEYTIEKEEEDGEI